MVSPSSNFSPSLLRGFISISPPKSRKTLDAKGRPAKIPSSLATITALFSYPTLLKLVQFTNAGYGLGMLAVYGVFSMVMFGAIYYIVPRLTLREWVSPHLIRLHFTFSVYGVVLIALAGTLVAGIQQGLLQENQDLSAIEVAMNSVSYSASMIIAWCLILLSNGFFVFHLFLMWLRRGKSSSRPTLLNDV